MKRRFKMLILGLVLSIFLVCAGFSGSKDFIQKEFDKVCGKGGPAYQNWKEGLLRDKSLKLDRLVPIITIISEVKDKDGEAVTVLFELVLKGYAKNPSGAKLTVVCQRLICVIITGDKIIDFEILAEKWNIVSGWDGIEI